MKIFPIIAALLVSMSATGCASLGEQAQSVNGSCEPGHDNRSSSLCADWAAVDAARAAVTSSNQATDLARWSFFIGLIGAFGLFFTIRESIKQSRVSSRSLMLSNPPHLKVTNIAIWVRGEDEECFPDLKIAHQEIEGRVFIVNVGRDVAHIGNNPPTARNNGKDEENWSSQCIAFWNTGPLPIIRPFQEGKDWHNPSDIKHLEPGRFHEWKFRTVSQPEMDLYIAGFVTYWGSEGNRRHTVFCRKYCPEKHRFFPEPAYPEYETEE
ncbi:hypothetical protein IWY39_002591 [Sphingobium sp. JAI105]|uniref:hypothetical protein n=1 Tax=Sphingobium sp. JAI105 TaxID=2787715 RepID=UPI0018CA9BE4|nr:hypothetical protein [Sphingobium sp. JAI105]MBG6118787.1 hypothetical protein [Sphingobium sp. JAI105]